MPEVEIRLATEEDVPLILRFIKQLAEYERLSHEVVATEESLRDSLFGEFRVAETLLAYLGDEPAGFALFFHNFSTFLGKPGIYLEDLYVSDEFRGAGVGRSLLAHLAKLAGKRGCGRLEWWVLDWNEPAIDFYKSLGAQPMDDWTVYRVAGEELHKLASGAA
ncbi:MAG: GNAT family N-acetyltransferase [Rubrobacteraceae bacterium]